MQERIEDIVLENVQTRYENFTGEERRNPNNNRVINKEGSRNFCVVISDYSYAQFLANQGWNIRMKEPREEGDEPFCLLPVTVRFDRIPPRVFMVTRDSVTRLDEETVKCLDGTRFKNVDVHIVPAPWIDDNGDRRIKAYLREGYFEIEEGMFAHKYAR